MHPPCAASSPSHHPPFYDDFFSAASAVSRFQYTMESNMCFTMGHPPTRSNGIHSQCSRNHVDTLPVFAAQVPPVLRWITNGSRFGRVRRGECLPLPPKDTACLAISTPGQGSLVSSRAGGGGKNTFTGTPSHTMEALLTCITVSIDLWQMVGVLFIIVNSLALLQHDRARCTMIAQCNGIAAWVNY